MPAKLLAGREFIGGGVATTNRAGRPYPRALTLSYYEPAAVSNEFTAAIAGKYQRGCFRDGDRQTVGRRFGQHRCRLTFGVDEAELLHNEYAAKNGRPHHYHS